jgi:starch phosphorylase
MKALRTFSVRPSLPPPLVALGELSLNLRWSWDRPTRELFERVDPSAWEASGEDPRALLGLVSLERLEALARDQQFLASL